MDGASIQDPDRPLVEQAQRGDMQAFSSLVKRYQRLLSSIAFGMLKDEGRMEDVVQETFLSAWKALPGFRGEAKFRNWLCRILLNKARSALRWSRLRSWVSLEALSGRKDPAVEGLRDGSGDADPERRQLQDERDRRIREAVASLPLQQRTAVLLRGGGMDVLEVAEAMGLAEGTVKAHLHHARERLEGLMGST